MRTESHLLDKTIKMGIEFLAHYFVEFREFLQSSNFLNLEVQGIYFLFIIPVTG